MKQRVACKRAGILLAGLILLSPAAFAQTTNIVRTTDPEQWDLMSVPLYISPSNRFGIIASNAAVGSTVTFYDPATSNFFSGAKNVKGWAAAQSNWIALPGKSFFLRAPSTGNVISVSGTIPEAPITNQVYERWSALGYPYPDPVVWTDTSLSSNLAVGTLVYFWDLGRQQYDIFRKGPPAKGGWGSASNHVIQPGDGFIVRQPPGSAPFLWVQDRGP